MTMMQGTARLGANPELKYIGVGDDQKPVCEVRLRILNGKQDKSTGEWLDQGFWAQGNIWGKFAEPAAKIFSKGDRVFFDGNMVMNTFPDKDNEGEEVKVPKIDISFIAPYLPDIESLKYKARTSKSDSQESAQQSTAAAS